MARASLPAAGTALRGPRHATLPRPRRLARTVPTATGRATFTERRCRASASPNRFPHTRLELRGRHRFARYVLVFHLDETGADTTHLRARTYAEFPGLRGRAYRALVTARAPIASSPAGSSHERRRPRHPIETSPKRGLSPFKEPGARSAGRRTLAGFGWAAVASADAPPPPPAREPCPARNPRRRPGVLLQRVGPRRRSASGNHRTRGLGVLHARPTGNIGRATLGGVQTRT